MVPVGLAGVPPQVHLVAACADVTPPARASALTPAQALAPSTARNETAALFESLRLFTFPAPFRSVAEQEQYVSNYLRKCQLATVRSEMRPNGSAGRDLRK